MTLIMNGIDFIQLTRDAQVEKGYTLEHDREHGDGSLIKAASCFIEHAYVATTMPGEDSRYSYEVWPWDIESFKPDPSDPIKDLAKAGALIAAEIDRLLAMKEKS